MARGRWQRVAMAAVLASGLLANDAWALALGRVAVQSLLGEPLRAEIDVPAITEAEAASLQVGIAPPERFRAANLDFNPLLQEVTLELQRRADGRTVILLRSQRPVSEPFLDLVVQARWAGGELLRGYTLLFDPPHLQPTPVPVAPAVSAPAAPPRVTDVRPPQPLPAPAAPAQAAAAPAPAARSPESTAAPATAERPSRLTVQRGETAGRIAAAHRPADVTLEQMLVALLRANPQAFIRDNVNLLRAGAVIDIPDAAQAAAIDAQEARRIVAAQTRDFNEYRRRLAAAAPAQEGPAASRAASGAVQAAVVEDKPQAAASDKLTLSKPGTPADAEAQLAEQRQRNETEQRVAELSRNLQELEQLRQSASAAAGTPSPAPADAPAPTAADTSAAPAPAMAEAPASPPTAPPPAPTVTAPVAPPPPPAAPAPAAAGPMTALLGNPATIPAAAGAAALMLAFAWWRLRRRRAEEQAREEPELPAEATADAAPESSMMYSPSQLDAGGDVDPVAEADVYLAYGREQQAEEILLEALRLHPERLPVRLKLLEIYAQRPDPARFEAAARELHEITGGSGPEWEQACTWGRQIDPDNLLYRPQAAPTPVSDSPPAQLAPAATPEDLALDEAAAVPPQPPAMETAATPDDDRLDFDLDLTLDSEGAPADAQATPASGLDATAAASERGAASLPPEDTAGGLDFELDLPPQSAAQAPTADPAAAGLDLELELPPSPGEPSPPPPAATAPTAPPTLPPELEGLTLDLPTDLPPTEPAAAAETPADDLSSLDVTEGLDDADPLETKLSLAREFEAIGDIDGARTLAEEVVAEASGELQERARAFLAQLA